MQLLIGILIFFGGSLFSYAQDSANHPDIAPPGFDQYLKNHKNSSFKVKVPIKQGRAPSMQEIKPGTRDEVIKLKSAMYKMKQDCSLKGQPNSTSSTVSVVRKNRKVWVEHYDVDWGKVYRKKGVAYIDRQCL
ncbi:MAG: hypothetical protein R2827_07780 [Bdellovibrionales bacterium]